MNPLKIGRKMKTIELSQNKKEQGDIMNLHRFQSRIDDVLDELSFDEQLINDVRKKGTVKIEGTLPESNVEYVLVLKSKNRVRESRENVRSLVVDVLKDVLAESKMEPDLDYTDWTPSDISYLEGKGFDYDENDDSFFKEFFRGDLMIMVQKRDSTTYLVRKLRPALVGKNSWRIVARSQDEMINAVREMETTIK